MGTARKEARYVIVLKTVYDLEIPVSHTSGLLMDWPEQRSQRKGSDAHVTTQPLHFLDDVQAAMHDELVHVSGLRAETGNTVAAAFGGAEFVLEDGVVLGANYAEIV